MSSSEKGVLVVVPSARGLVLVERAVSIYVRFTASLKSLTPGASSETIPCAGGCPCPIG